MTPNQAFEELGLAHGAPADAVRRAYLGLLKKRKPELDPEGFRRLREAYEILQKLAEVAAPPRVAPRAAGPDGGAAGDLDLTPHAVNVLPPVPLPAPVATPGEARLADLALALRAALAQRDWQAAAGAMEEAFVMGSRAPGLPVPPPGDVIDCMFRLHQVGSSEALWASLALGRAFQGWMLACQLEARVLGGPLAIPWSMLRELGTLSEQVPQAVRSGAAAVVLEGDKMPLARATAKMGIDDPKAARALAYHLRDSSPILASLMARDLIDAAKVHDPWHARLTPGSVVGLAVLAMLLLRLLSLFVKDLQ